MKAFNDSQDFRVANALSLVSQLVEGFRRVDGKHPGTDVFIFVNNELRHISSFLEGGQHVQKMPPHQMRAFLRLAVGVVKKELPDAKTESFTPVDTDDETALKGRVGALHEVLRAELDEQAKALIENHVELQAVAFAEHLQAAKKTMKEIIEQKKALREATKEDDNSKDEALKKATVDLGLHANNIINSLNEKAGLTKFLKNDKARAALKIQEGSFPGSLEELAKIAKGELVSILQEVVSNADVTAELDDKIKGDVKFATGEAENHNWAAWKKTQETIEEVKSELERKNKEQQDQALEMVKKAWDVFEKARNALGVSQKETVEKLFTDKKAFQEMVQGGAPVGGQKINLSPASLRGLATYVRPDTQPMKPGTEREEIINFAGTVEENAVHLLLDEPADNIVKAVEGILTAGKLLIADVKHNSQEEFKDISEAVATAQNAVTKSTAFEAKIGDKGDVDVYSCQQYSGLLKNKLQGRLQVGLSKMLSEPAKYEEMSNFMSTLAEAFKKEFTEKKEAANKRQEELAGKLATAKKAAEAALIDLAGVGIVANTEEEITGAQGIATRALVTYRDAQLPEGGQQQDWGGLLRILQNAAKKDENKAYLSDGMLEGLNGASATNAAELTAQVDAVVKDFTDALNAANTTIEALQRYIGGAKAAAEEDVTQSDADTVTSKMIAYSNGLPHELEAIFKQLLGSPDSHSRFF